MLIGSGLGSGRDVEGTTASEDARWERHPAAGLWGAGSPDSARGLWGEPTNPTAAPWGGFGDGASASTVRLGSGNGASHAASGQSSLPLAWSGVVPSRRESGAFGVPFAASATAGAPPAPGRTEVADEDDAMLCVSASGEDSSPFSRQPSNERDLCGAAEEGRAPSGSPWGEAPPRGIDVAREAQMGAIAYAAEARTGAASPIGGARSPLSASHAPYAPSSSLLSTSSHLSTGFPADPATSALPFGSGGRGGVFPVPSPRAGACEAPPNSRPLSTKPEASELVLGGHALAGGIPARFSPVDADSGDAAASSETSPPGAEGAPARRGDVSAPLLRAKLRAYAAEMAGTWREDDEEACPMGADGASDDERARAGRA